LPADGIMAAGRAGDFGMSPDSSSIKLRFSSIKQATFFQVLTQPDAATGRGG
jgi:hypothetical protein